MSRDLDLTVRVNVIRYMEETEDLPEWNRRCRDVKRANDNRYPDYWQEEIMQRIFSSKQRAWMR